MVRKSDSSGVANRAQKHPALDIINNILLEGMKVVGICFGSGQMQVAVRVAVS